MASKSDATSCLEENFGMNSITVGLGISDRIHRWDKASAAVSRCFGSYTRSLDSISNPDSFRYALPEKEVKGNTSRSLSRFPILY